MNVADPDGYRTHPTVFQKAGLISESAAVSLRVLSARYARIRDRKLRPFCVPNRPLVIRLKRRNYARANVTYSQLARHVRTGRPSCR